MAPPNPLTNPQITDALVLTLVRLTQLGRLIVWDGKEAKSVKRLRKGESTNGHGASLYLET